MCKKDKILDLKTQLETNLKIYKENFVKINWEIVNSVSKNLLSSDSIQNLL